MPNNIRPKILVCGVLPPPYFGHSVMYEMLMKSAFPESVNVRFLNMHFWSYQTNKKVTFEKIFKMAKYYIQYLGLIIFWQPQYVLYNSSFYRMPFLKDLLFCGTGIVLRRQVIFHDFGQYVAELYESLSGWQRNMLRWMLKNAEGSIVMGENVRKTYQGLMDDSKIFSVPGVVEDSHDWKAQPNRPDHDFLNVLYFSHMSKDKGVFVAFDACALILQANRKVVITFAGPMENEEVALRLEKLQKEYPARVRYLGYVEDATERTSIFRGADVFIFPTLRDVFGLVLLHAMAEGIPIVASKEGTIPEIVMEAETGFLCSKGNSQEFAQKTLELLSNPDLRKRMSSASRSRFDSVYNLNQYSQRMVKVFVK